MKIGKIGKK